MNPPHVHRNRSPQSPQNAAAEEPFLGITMRRVPSSRASFASFKLASSILTPGLLNEILGVDVLSLSSVR
jgi:hypothetical protein